MRESSGVPKPDTTGTSGSVVYPLHSTPEPSISVTTQDGRIYTGWHAVPWVILFSPLIAVAMLLVGFLTLMRFITRRDAVLGWRYDAGIWRREC